MHGRFFNSQLIHELADWEQQRSFILLIVRHQINCPFASWNFYIKCAGSSVITALRIRDCKYGLLTNCEWWTAKRGERSHSPFSDGASRLSSRRFIAVVEEELIELDTGIDHSTGMVGMFSSSITFEILTSRHRWILQYECTRIYWRTWDTGILFISVLRSSQCFCKQHNIDTATTVW